MRDVPAVGWMLLASLFLSTGLLVYSRSGSDVLPPMKSAWAHLDSVEELLETRKIDLRVGERQEEISPPYRIRLERLNDSIGARVIARYRLQILPLPGSPHKDPWLGNGVEMALIDLQPTALLGFLQLIAIRRTS